MQSQRYYVKNLSNIFFIRVKLFINVVDKMKMTILSVYKKIKTLQKSLRVFVTLCFSIYSKKLS